MPPISLPHSAPGDLIGPDPVRMARTTATLCLVVAGALAAYKVGAAGTSAHDTVEWCSWVLMAVVIAPALGVLALGWHRIRARVSVLHDVAFVVLPPRSIAAWRVGTVATIWALPWSLEENGWPFPAAVAAVTVWQATMAWRSVPQVRLYRDRLELRGPFGITMAPWTAISPEPGLWTTTPAGLGPGRGALLFPLVEPGRVRGRWLLSRWRDGTSATLPVHHRGLGVPVEYLSDLIMTYVKQPELRSRIGTRAEAERLTTEWLSAMAARGGTPARS